MNWGHRLTIVFTVFASGMGYMVYRSMHVNTELVTKDYYKNELRYQEVIDGTKNANALSTSVVIIRGDNAITIRFPEEMKNKTITGSMWFYCAANKGNDRNIPIALDENAAQHIELSSLAKGQYTIKFDWYTDSKHYYTEKIISVL